jgi:hypothetical protein
MRAPGQPGIAVECLPFQATSETDMTDLTVQNDKMMELMRS